MKLFNDIKGEFGIRSYFIAMLFFGGIIAIFSLMVGSLANSYNSDNIIDSDFKDRYSSFDNFTSRIESIRNTLTSGEGISILNIGFGVFSATFSFFQLTLRSLGLIGTTTSNFTEDFNLPYQLAAIVFGIFIGVIVITIVVRILNSLNPGKI